MRWTDLIRRARYSRPAGSSDLGQWIEAALLVMLLIQFARLLWALVTPVGLYGDWRAREPVVVSADARAALFAGFDPFFRTGVAVGPGQTPVQQITSLPLKLFGIRLNEASGLGAAIIANEGGVQTSYAVGEEISPGVKLKAVAFDHVVIDRNGATENLFIDQSGSGTPGAPGQPAMPGMSPVPTGPMGPGGPGALAPMGLSAGVPPQGAPPGVNASKIASAVSLQPRTEAGKVTGIVVSARDDAMFAAAGFRPGDIVVQVNGQPVRSASDVQNLQSMVAPGARISLMVERGSATVPIALILPDIK